MKAASIDSAPCVDVAALCWIENHPGLAAWMQAVLSVAAIAIAILVPVWMAHRERRHRQTHLGNHAVQVAGVVVAAIEVFARSAGDPEKRKVFSAGGFPMHVFGAAEEALASLNVTDIEDQEVARALRMLKIHLAGSMDDCEDFAEFSESDDGGQDWAAAMSKRSEKANQLYELIQNRVRSRPRRS